MLSAYWLYREMKSVYITSPAQPPFTWLLLVKSPHSANRHSIPFNSLPCGTSVCKAGHGQFGASRVVFLITIVQCFILNKEDMTVINATFTSSLSISFPSTLSRSLSLSRLFLIALSSAGDRLLFPSLHCCRGFLGWCWRNSRQSWWCFQCPHLLVWMTGYNMTLIFIVQSGGYRLCLWRFQLFVLAVEQKWHEKWCFDSPSFPLFSSVSCLLLAVRSSRKQTTH